MRKVLLLAMGLCLVLSGSSFAFHDAGVDHCNGCHTMHNSEDGALVDPNSADGNPFLLVDATPSDVCLGCHATGYNMLLNGTATVPIHTLKGAGSFIHILDDNLNDGHGGATNPIGGDAAGHNLNAPGHDIATDGKLAAAPGGTFPANLMGCSSCHDPHGTDAFRLLYGAGRLVQGHAFANAAPDAVRSGPIYYAGAEANDLHTAYNGGMSAWCGNCHGDYHANGSQYVHPTGGPASAMTNVAATYNAYNGTDDQTGGVLATSYLAAVPFEDALVTTTSTTGPTGTSQVMCLSCHRAHASSAPNAGRWDFSVTLLEEDGVASGSYPIPDPYASVNQRSLCNKCHNKDAYDHVVVIP